MAVYLAVNVLKLCEFCTLRVSTKMFYSFNYYIRQEPLFRTKQTREGRRYFKLKSELSWLTKTT